MMRHEERVIFWCLSVLAGCLLALGACEFKAHIESIPSIKTAHHYILR